MPEYATNNTRGFRLDDLMFEAHKLEYKEKLRERHIKIREETQQII